MTGNMNTSPAMASDSSQPAHPPRTPPSTNTSFQNIGSSPTPGRTLAARPILPPRACFGAPYAWFSATARSRQTEYPRNSAVTAPQNIAYRNSAVPSAAAVSTPPLRLGTEDEMMTYGA